MPKRECPIEGCETQHDTKLLMCPLHWYRVPKDIRDEVYAAYRSEEGILGDRYQHARQIAIDAATNG